MDRIGQKGVVSRPDSTVDCPQVTQSIRGVDAGRTALHGRDALKSSRHMRFLISTGSLKIRENRCVYSELFLISDGSTTYNE